MDFKKIKTTKKITKQEMEWIKNVIQSQKDDPKAKAMIAEIKKSRSLLIS